MRKLVTLTLFLLGFSFSLLKAQESISFSLDKSLSVGQQWKYTIFTHHYMTDSFSNDSNTHTTYNAVLKVKDINKDTLLFTWTLSDYDTEVYDYLQLPDTIHKLLHNFLVSPIDLMLNKKANGHYTHHIHNKDELKTKAYNTIEAFKSYAQQNRKSYEGSFLEYLGDQLQHRVDVGFNEGAGHELNLIVQHLGKTYKLYSDSCKTSSEPNPMFSANIPAKNRFYARQKDDNPFLYEVYETKNIRAEDFLRSLRYLQHSNTSANVSVLDDANYFVFSQTQSTYSTREAMITDILNSTTQNTFYNKQRMIHVFTTRITMTN